MVSSSGLATLELGLLHTLRIRDCATTLIRGIAATALPTRKAAAPQRPLLSVAEPELTAYRSSDRRDASGILGH